MTDPQQAARFTWFERQTNALAPYAIPALKFVSPALQPLYQLSDAVAEGAEKFFQGGDEAAPRPPSNSYGPVVVFSSRTVRDASEYRTLFAKYASEAQGGGEGVRMMFSFLDRDASSPTALQVAWYDGPADYAVQPKELRDCYAGTEETDYTLAFGGWDESLKIKARQDAGGGGCAYSFSETMAGYLKEPAEEHAADFRTGEAPMIWVSRRKLRPGRRDLAARSFQKGVDRMYTNAPAALGIIEFPDPSDPDGVWSLRVFNEFERGFKRHFPVPSAILFRMVLNVVPEWADFPIAFSFSARAEIEGAIESNPGNQAYSKYYFDEGGDLIGPEPDFGKGF